MYTLKKTETFKKGTLERTSALIVTDGKQVYLKNGDDCSLIEKDLRLYRTLMNDPKKHARARITHLILEPTYRCNLECPICFTGRQTEELALPQIRQSVSEYRNAVMSISGGEPTVHPELDTIIRIIAEQNIPLLATNGMEIDNPDYLKRLEDSGLRHITFSLNGLTGDVLRQLNGRDVLRRKIDAIENIMRTHIYFLISVLLVKDINENQIRPILEFSGERRRRIKEVRFRTLAPIGRYKTFSPVFPSDIIQEICRQMDFSVESIYKELEFKRKLTRLFPSFASLQKPCSFSFHLKKGRKGLRPIGERRDFIPLLLKLYTRAVMGGSGKQSIWYHDESFLKISVRVWPGADSFDMREHYTLCNSRYIAGRKKGLPVCYANILQDREG